MERDNMNNSSQNLITTYVCKSGKEYVVKMRVADVRRDSSLLRRNLDLTVTDKYTAEDWQSSYDMAYIENLTHKTGNYKQFDVFVAMLQSGLLKTSDCVTLDLLTFEDLELLRLRRTEGNPGSSSAKGISNRRYLIVTYTVEFDRIHYPLPLEYRGPPDTTVLQSTIRKLETELQRLRSSNGSAGDLHKKVEQLMAANKKLVEENRRLSDNGKEIRRLLEAVKSLESAVAEERASFKVRIKKLRAKNASLMTKLHQSHESAIRKSRDSSPILAFENRCSSRRRHRSRSALGSRRLRGSSSLDLPKSADSSNHEIFKPHRFKTKEIDFGNLESRIHILQKMLKDGINLN